MFLYIINNFIINIIIIILFYFQEMLFVQFISNSNIYITVNICLVIYFIDYRVFL